MIYRLLFLASVLLWTFPCRGQALRQLVMQVELTGPADSVWVRSLLTIDNLSERDSIPLKGLLHRNARIADLLAMQNGRALEIAWEEGAGRLWRGWITRPDGRSFGPDSIQIELYYAVTGHPVNPQRMDLVLPVLYADWAPVTAARQTFQCTLALPKRFRIVECFPGVRRRMSPSATGFDHDFDLQTVPAIVHLLAVDRSERAYSVLDAVDLGVMLLLLGFLYFGWQHLKRQQL